MLWLKADGTLVVDSEGRLMDCPDCPCDGGGGPSEIVGCDACPTCCPDGVSRYRQVTLSGFVADALYPWANGFNGTFTIEQQGVEAGYCYWRLRGFYHGGVELYIDLVYDEAVRDYYLHFGRWGFSDGFSYWCSDAGCLGDFVAVPYFRHDVVNDSWMTSIDVIEV